MTAFFLGEGFKLALTLLALLAIVKWQPQAHWGMVLLGMTVALLAPLPGLLFPQKDSPGQAGDASVTTASSARPD